MILHLHCAAQAASEALARDKQRMLNEEKAAIHNLVKTSFEPLIAKLAAR